MPRRPGTPVPARLGADRAFDGGGKAASLVADGRDVPSGPLLDAEEANKRVSALAAAAQVLNSAGKPMRAHELIAAMAEQNLWKSPGGKKTPHATLYAAMMREERDKGTASRFHKVDRGLLEFNKAGA